MTDKSNERDGCFHQEATKRSAAEWAALSGATERGSAQMAMPSGIGPQGWLDRAPNWAERATSHAGFAGNVHFSSFIVRFSFGGADDQSLPQCLLNRALVHAMNSEN